MTGVVCSDTCPDDQLCMLMVCDLRIPDKEFLKDLFSPLLTFGVGALRFIGRDLGRRFVAPSPGWEEDDRRQQVEIAKRGYQLWRRDLTLSRVHR